MWLIREGAIQVEGEADFRDPASSPHEAPGGRIFPDVVWGGRDALGENY